MQKELIVEEITLLEELKKAEQQIKNGEVVDAEIVFTKLKEKYGF